jgi:DNA-binding MarR family transcriptional regulator
VELDRDQSPGYVVNLVARLFALALHRRISPYGVVPGQFPALLCLYEEDGLTQAELCRRVSIEQPTMANTLKRMERDGLIRREPDPLDGRRTRISLTARARRLEGRLSTRANEVNAIALSGLQPAEARSVLPILNKIAENLRKDVPGA